MKIHVNEAEDQKTALAKQAQALKANNKSMDSLVQALNNLTPQQLDLLELGFGDNTLATDMETEEKPLKVKDLRPTQNEIDVGKSLSFQLDPKDPEATKAILKGGPVTVNLPLVVYDYKGKHYIVDGHHRWSQVYLLNPNCEINCIVFKNSAGGIAQDPVDMLRDFQGAIAVANNGNVPSATVKQGMNIFDWSDEQLRDYIDKNITDKMAQAYSEYYDSAVKKDAIAKTIIANADLMRSLNTPVDGAPSRAVMPQTDTGNNAGLKTAMKGMTDI